MKLYNTLTYTTFYYHSIQFCITSFVHVILLTSINSKLTNCENKLLEMSSNDALIIHKHKIKFVFYIPKRNLLTQKCVKFYHLLFLVLIHICRKFVVKLPFKFYLNLSQRSMIHQRSFELNNFTQSDIENFLKTHDHWNTARWYAS